MTGPADDAPAVDLDAPVADVTRPTRTPWWLTVAVLVVTSVIGASVIAVIEAEAKRRAMFLVVPFGALLSWMATRLLNRRTVPKALVLAVAVVAIGLAGDYASAVWGLERLGQLTHANLTYWTIAKNPRGIVRFLHDHVWRSKDYLLAAGGALAATVIAWPASRPGTATMEAPALDPDTVSDTGDGDGTSAEHDDDVSDSGGLDDAVAREPSPRVSADSV
jgi:hypothetical protein